MNLVGHSGFVGRRRSVYLRLKRPRFVLPCFLPHCLAIPFPPTLSPPRQTATETRPDSPAPILRPLQIAPAHLPKKSPRRSGPLTASPRAASIHHSRHPAATP